MRIQWIDICTSSVSVGFRCVESKQRDFVSPGQKLGVRWWIHTREENLLSSAQANQKIVLGRLVHIISIFQCPLVEHTVLLAEIILREEKKKKNKRQMSTKGFGEIQAPVEEEKTDEILQKVFSNLPGLQLRQLMLIQYGCLNFQQRCF